MSGGDLFRPTSGTAPRTTMHTAPMIARWRGLTLVVAGLQLAAVGCSPTDRSVGSVSSGEPASIPASVPAADTAADTIGVLPSDPPGILGVVTRADGATLRIETNPAEEYGSPKAVVRITPETRILYRSGQVAAASDLTIGHNVSAWFSGPVMESYPVQTTAGTVVIEPTGSI